MEDLVGKKKAKEIWFLNPRMTASEALAIGLIKAKVVPDDKWREESGIMATGNRRAGRVSRSAALKAAFTRARGGVSGLAAFHDCCCGL